MQNAEMQNKSFIHYEGKDLVRFMLRVMSTWWLIDPEVN